MIPRPRATSDGFVMKMSARRETDADATYESPNGTIVILTKTFTLSSCGNCGSLNRSSAPTFHSYSLGWVTARGSEMIARQRKTRPGGQPGGSSYTGRWGGWALAPNTASSGRDFRSHIHESRRHPPTFNAVRIFFGF